MTDLVKDNVNDQPTNNIGINVVINESGEVNLTEEENKKIAELIAFIRQSSKEDYRIDLSISKNRKLKRHTKRLLRLRNYDLAIFAAFIAGVALDILLGSHGSDDFSLSDFLHNTLFNAVSNRDPLSTELFDFSFLSTTVSAFSYIGRSIDTLTDETTFLHLIFKPLPDAHRNKELKKFNLQKFRNYGSLAGALLGVIFAIIFASLLIFAAPFSIPLLLTFITGSIILISALAGLGSRLFQPIDRIIQQETWEWVWTVTNNKKNKLICQKKPPDNSLKKNYELAIIYSLSLSLIPVIFLLMNPITITPLAIFILISTIIVTISVITSGSHYIGRSLDFITGNRTIFSLLDIFNFTKNLLPQSKYFKDSYQQPLKVNENFYENVLTTVGLVLGLILGIAIVSMGIFMPAFLIALPFALKAPLVVLFTMNMCTSILSRLGRAIDRTNIFKATEAISRNNSFDFTGASGSSSRTNSMSEYIPPNTNDKSSKEEEEDTHPSVQSSTNTKLSDQLVYTKADLITRNSRIFTVCRSEKPVSVKSRNATNADLRYSRVAAPAA